MNARYIWMHLNFIDLLLMSGIPPESTDHRAYGIFIDPEEFKLVEQMIRDGS